MFVWCRIRATGSGIQSDQQNKGLCMHLGYPCADTLREKRGSEECEKEPQRDKKNNDKWSRLESITVYAYIQSARRNKMPLISLSVTML